MTLYRVHKTLAIKDQRVPRGSLVPLTFPHDTIARLIEHGAISVAETPPLAILPGWEQYLETAGRGGLKTAGDFLESDNAALSSLFNLDCAIIQRMKDALIRDWLTIPEPKRG